MTTVKLSSKGNILIPKAYREICRLTPGMELAITVVNGEIHLKPTLPQVTPTTVAAGRGLLADKGRHPLTDADIKQRISARLKTQDAATKSPE
jgi:AbrB family looped-hinge helix DNA binding protein